MEILRRYIPTFEEKPFKLFDTMRRRVVEVSPLQPPKFRMYTCGPTVYDWPHIGNLRTFTQEDILRRWLKIKGFQVEQVMNLTDVDDKTIRRSREMNLSLREYTDKYVKAFFDSITALNIERAEHYPRATEYIPQMVEMIKKLMEKGLAYKGSDGSIYYSVSKFPGYGKLSGIDLSKIKPGARISQDEYDKDSPADFALWKAWTPEDGEVFWETEIGKGRPGWHIECSVMSTSILGPTLDLHGGGVDLIFPHHENEIAQSEGATGVEFCRHWFHVEHLMVEGEKMSKSLGNIFTVPDLLKKGFDPLALRLFYLQSHYRQKQNFTWEALRASQRALDRLRASISELRKSAEEGTKGKGQEELDSLLRKHISAITEAMDNDLNVPKALSHLFMLVDDLIELSKRGVRGESIKEALLVLEALDDALFGLKLFEKAQERSVRNLQDVSQGARTLSDELERDIGKLVRIRSEARARKDWALADEIREELRKLGVALEDTKEGTRYRIEPGTDLEALAEGLRKLVERYAR